MKVKLMLLFLLFCSLSHATIYYISPSGNDANNGSSGSPWKTLAYACSKATASGDIIHVNAGTYALTSSVSLPTGVSIEGEGVASLFTSSVTGSGSGAGVWTIKLNSAMGTNGNQHISNIKMDGLNLTGWGAIGVNGRSNVKIYNCTFINFNEVAVTFNGQAGYNASAPATFGTGNELHDCIVTNCAGYRGSNDYGAGNIMIGGQSGLLIYKNTIIQKARPNNLNGYIIKYYSGGYNKAVKIYDNYLEAEPRAGTEATSSWGFVLEQWNPIGGWEIYGNTIKGCLDLVNISKGSYAYSFDIHDNNIGFDSTPPTGTTQGDVGIRLESYFQSVNIHHNHFKNHVTSVYASSENGPASDGLNMYSNIFENVGGNNNTGWVFRYTNDGSTYNVSNLNFWNNTMVASTAYSTNYAITIPFGNVSNVSIKNNIIVGFNQGPVQKGVSGSGTNISIENNAFYDNGSSNAPAGSLSYSNYTYQNNLTVDPQFVSSGDFHLKSSSPAIGKGISVGLTTDYDGNSWKNPPSIGAYESGSTPTVPTVPVYQSAFVENATPNIIELSYDLSLANIVPVASVFNVQVNSVGRTVSSVTIAGTKVRLNLASAVVFGDAVTVAYVKPATNPLQTTSGGVAASFSAKTVMNNVSNTIPAYVSSAIQNATPNTLEITYNSSLASIIPAAAAFIVMVNSVARTVSTVSVSGTKVLLTLSSPVVNANVVTVSYTKPATNPLQTVSGGQAGTLSAKTVVNNVSAAIPVYVRSAIENSTPNILEMTYNSSLAIIVPAAAAFSVMVNSVARTVNTVSVSATKVLLTLSSPVVNGNVVTVSYTRPATNPLQTASGGQAATLSAQTVLNNVSSANPLYVSSAIQNANPNTLEMTYNLNLASIVPAASAFSVMVNSVARTVNTVTVSGTKVLLTLSSPVANGNVVTVSYTKPASNPLQTTAGGQAATLSTQTVTNNVNAAIPVYVSSAIQNATPNKLEMTYNLSLANIIPAASAFSVLVNSVARSVSSVAITGVQVQLTLSSAVVFGDIVTVAYTKPSTNPLQTASGTTAAGSSNRSVINNVGALAQVPVVVNSVVENASPSILIMTFDLSLANIKPATTAFKVMVNSASRAISSVAVSGTRVQLTLASRLFQGDIMNISYTKPSANPIQTSSGGLASDITSMPVINNCINNAPAATISSPASNSSFTSPASIVINANASDTDGTISVVEFYNGTTLIGSRSAAPYSFTWSNVDVGSYSITVVATDNFNSKTASTPISVFVINSEAAINEVPVVQISNPRKGNVYDKLSSIAIDAIASDPDGTISKVEFYNGTVRLVELTSAPYSYIWKDVAAGTYSLTAVATDNQNARTVSASIEFVVGENDKNLHSDRVNLYPNPNNGNFSIEFANPSQNGTNEIIIMDLSGKLVYSKPLPKEETLLHFELSGIKSGMYVMMIKNKEILITKKFVIK